MNSTDVVGSGGQTIMVSILNPTCMMPPLTCRYALLILVGSKGRYYVPSMLHYPKERVMQKTEKKSPSNHLNNNHLETSSQIMRHEPWSAVHISQ